MKRLQTYLLLVLSLILLGTLPIAAAESKAEWWSYPSSNPGLSSFDGSGTASSPYLIQSAQDLANLAYIVTDANDDVTGKYFKMTRDIYLNDFYVDDKNNVIVNGTLNKWTPIGEYGKMWDDDFQGIFDGDGHTIYGLYINETWRIYVGLFGSTEDATIKNLTIKNAYIDAAYYNADMNNLEVGTLIGNATNTTISNVHVEGAYIKIVEPKTPLIYIAKGNVLYIGGLVGIGYSGNLTLNDCSYDGKFNVISYYESVSGGAVGGLIGTTDCTTHLTRCQNKGEIKVKLDGGNTKSGGFIGGWLSSTCGIYFTDCVNRANITIYSDEKTERTAYASNFAYNFIKATRSVNLGNITIVSDKILYPTIGISFGDSKYVDCANYGHYILSENHDSIYSDIYPGQNQVYHNNNGENLIVWQEAKPTYLGTNDIYNSNGTELGLDSLNNNRALVAKLNEEAGANVWGFYELTDSGKTYSVPFPIACGGTPVSLYKNDKGQYQISSEADLRILQTLIKSDSIADRNFILTHDIDMSASEPLTQLGDENHPFTGTLDGNGHVISGLTIKGHALFGNLSGTVKNLALMNITFIGGNDHCAPFAYQAGCSADASILNCYAGGDITIADSTNASTTLAGLLYEATDNKVSVKNCYFRGIMANATNLSNQGHFYYGLLGSNKIGTSLTLSDCYAHFGFNEMLGIGAGLMPNNDASTPDSTNCHYLCPQFNDSIGRILSNAELAACFAGKEGWLTGAYRPVLEGARHYKLTTYDGQTVYADAIPMDDDSCRNEIFCHELTTETATDPLLWALPKVAACDTENNVNYLLPTQLYADKPFRFSPPEGSVTKGQIHYPLTFTDEEEYAIRLMCLPATLHKSNLPEDAQVYLMGKPTGDADEGYEAYLVACDSVPAGVPFLILMSKKPSETIDMVLRGDIVTEPQSTGTLNGEELESGLSGTFEDKHLESGCAGFDFSTAGVNVKYQADGIDLKPFEAYIDAEKADATVSCDAAVLLRETSNYIDQTLATYKDRTVTVFLTRKLQAGGWNTLCLPFDVSKEELIQMFGSDTRIEELTSITTDADGTCTLNFTGAQGIEAGKCYLFKPAAANISSHQFDNKTLTTDLLPTTLTSSDGSYTVSFLGSFARTAIDGNDTSKGTYFTQNNKLYKVAQGRTITMNGFRCWIETSKPDALTKANIIHADGTTSIARIVPIGTTEDNHRIYDLQGIEVTHPLPHHIYIKDGKKGSQTH